MSDEEKYPLRSSSGQPFRQLPDIKKCGALLGSCWCRMKKGHRGEHCDGIYAWPPGSLVGEP